MNDNSIQIFLQEEPLNVGNCEAFVAGAGNGGTCVFIGTVRDQTQGKKVLRLSFEAYEFMALKEMHRIAAAALEQWAVQRIAIHHRTGIVYPGDTVVVIAVSAPHRQAAFAACQYAIDTLKQSVPIWKKEIFEDGEVWVAAHP